MDWQEKLRRVLVLDAQELALWKEIASLSPSGIKEIIREMLWQEKSRMEDIKRLLGECGSPPWVDPWAQS